MLEIQALGNLGADAEYKEFKGKLYLAFKIAHNERPDANGNRNTIWISCLKPVRERTKIIDFLKKGTSVFIRGGLSVKPYQAKDGTWQSNINCIVYDLEIASVAIQNSQTQSNTVSSGANPTTKKQDPWPVNDDLPF